MKNTNQQVFKNLMQKLEIQPAQTNKEKFNEWMFKMKNKYYSDNEKMVNAYNRIVEFN